MTQQLRLSFVAWALVALVAPSSAAATAKNPCAAGKIKAASRKALCLAKLEADEAAKNVAPDPAKIQKCRDKLPTAFASLESKGGCATSGDAAAVEASVDQFVDELAAALDETDPPEPNLCEAAKIRAAAANTDCKLKIRAQRAANPRSPPNPFKQQKCRDRLAATFARLESKNVCNTIDDSDETDELIDAFVEVIDQLAPPLEASCSPVQAAVLHGAPELFLSSSRLALIRKGKVPCGHVENLNRASCAFLGDASGAWLESPQGNFALAGQAISRKGEPGGEYVIGSEIDDDLVTPCIEPSGGDFVGTSTGIELGGTCAYETYLSPRNALGYPLENYATREVCTSSLPHPDDPGPTFLGCHGGEGDPFYCCYTAQGAGLNDPCGRERDSSGVYLTGASHYCHVAPNDGVVWYAAKRPATRPFPPPAGVQLGTPLVWRPVSPLVGIAN